ncbi:MAG: N-acetylmuramoyl-L-alanine amidase [Verrucomicrobiae bacterium]|nr:N-acetylmuramoyl-L-alanine amidase [Verrucomicrobiae bacterium]
MSLDPDTLLLEIALFTGRGLIVLVVALFADWLLRKRRSTSAEVSDFFWRSVFLSLAVVPLLSILPVHWESALVPSIARVADNHHALIPQQSAEMVAPLIVPATMDDVPALELLSAGGNQEVDLPEDAFLSRSLTLGLVVFWAIGALWLSGRVAFGLLNVARILNRCTPVQDPAWLTDAALIAEELGIRRLVRVVSGTGISIPFAAGLFRHHLVVPETSLTLPPEERRMLLRHELTHIQRGDVRMRILARMTLALHWINPLVWIANRLLLDGEERAVDDAVLADASVRSTNYAQLLSRFASESSRYRPCAAMAGIAPMAQASTVEDRIRCILDPTRLRHKPSRLMKGVLLASGLGSLVLSSIVQAQDTEELLPDTSTANDALPLSVSNSEGNMLTKSYLIASDQWADEVGNATAESFIEEHTGISFQGENAAVFDLESGRLLVTLDGQETMNSLTGFLAKRFRLLALSQVYLTSKQVILPDKGTLEWADDLRQEKPVELVGILTDAQYQVIIHSIAELPEAQMRSLPSVIARGRQQVTMDLPISEEFPFGALVITPEVERDGAAINLTGQFGDTPKWVNSFWSGQTMAWSLRPPGIAEDDPRVFLQFITAEVFDESGEPVRPSAKIVPRYKFNTVVLDPGHGGRDSGGRSGELVEKDLNLDLAKRTRNALERAGFEVVLTRQRDDYLSLSERIELAKVIPNPVFVSLHLGASTNREAKGFGVFYTSPTSNGDDPSIDGTSTDLAEEVQKSLANSIGETTRDRGTHRASFFVLRHATWPAIFVEAGCLTNPDDAVLIADEAHRNKVADAIAKGVIAFSLDD